MPFETESQSLTLRQRWILTGILTTVVVVGSADVISDLFDGATLGHMSLELGGLAVGVAGVAWIWMKNQRLAARGAYLGSRLAAVNAEAEAWRVKSQELMRGLSKAIDDQLETWSLSSAEKEVALLLLKGLSLKEVSDVRGTAERTTRQQAQEVYRKSGLAGRAELAAFFLEDILLPR
jgi:DNA-binding CsgD family transcriptional regulator